MQGDWLVRFDTLQPALQAGLPATVVVDRPVIQQILLNHGVPENTVRIKSRIKCYEELGEGRGIKVVLEDGSIAYCDVLVGADGIWSSVRKQLHGLDKGADGAAASGAAGGALDEREARRMAKDSILMASGANRRFSGFTCYAALCEHKASNIEEVRLGEERSELSDAILYNTLTPLPRRFSLLAGLLPDPSGEGQILCLHGRRGGEAAVVCSHQGASGRR